MSRKLVKKNRIINRISKRKNKRDFSLNSSSSKNSKFQLCKFYIKGKCRNGHSCQFLHSTTPITKKKLCWYYIAGNCSKNNECQYSHDISQFPCRYLNTVGFCRNLKNCRFSHELITTDEQREMFVRENKDYLLLPHEKGGPNEMSIDHMWWKPILNKIIQEDEKLANKNSLLKSLYNESNLAVPKEICTDLLSTKEKISDVTSLNLSSKNISEINFQSNRLQIPNRVKTNLTKKNNKMKNFYSNLHRTTEETFIT